jgi:hypothetical protein
MDDDPYSFKQTHSHLSPHISLTNLSDHIHFPLLRYPIGPIPPPPLTLDFRRHPYLCIPLSLTQGTVLTWISHSGKSEQYICNFRSDVVKQNSSSCGKIQLIPCPSVVNLWLIGWLRKNFEINVSVTDEIDELEVLFINGKRILCSTLNFQKLHLLK